MKHAAARNTAIEKASKAAILFGKCPFLLACIHITYTIIALQKYSILCKTPASLIFLACAIAGSGY